MTMQDPLADMLTRVRNAQTARLTEVEMPSSRTKVDIAQVLKDEGYIEEFSVDAEAKPTLTIILKYFSGRPVIEEIKRVSRPGLRKYKGNELIPAVTADLEIAPNQHLTLRSPYLL